MDPRREDAIHNERFVKIICIGAGFSGLCLAYKLRRSFTNYSLTIYEKNPKIGGTWFENRYPGCACDVPSHNYTYSFEPKADFSSVYASSKEIADYLEGFATKYDLWKHIRTSHRVTEASWDPARGQWDVTAIVTMTDQAGGAETTVTVRDSCHILVHATGYLNKPAWPSVPGLERFRGAKLHSAAWDESVSLAGKRVLLVGSGASSVQILPAIQPVAESVTVFIRTPRWTLPSPSSSNGGRGGKFSPEDLERFANDPDAVLNLRLENERTLNSFFTMYMKGTVLQNQARQLLEAEMKRLLVDPEMREKLVPDFPVGCKRILPSGFPFLKSLQEDNVTAVYAGVQAFTETGCISTDGQQHAGDVVVCATGFDVSFVPRYPILFDGHNLQDDWAASVTGYMGVGIAECPNAFTMGGPWTPISNGPVIAALESQADFICAFVDKYQTEPALHSMRLKAAASYDFRAYAARATARMVWADDCRNAHNVRPNWGQPSITWPGSTLHYLEALREPRFEDYDFAYAGNRFAWMGDGVSQTEWDPTADLAYYIRNRDDGRHLSRRARLREMAKSGSQPPRELHRQAKLSAPQEPSSGAAA